jgi:redox-sensitive bicupin YhaK (pirin superfamily)
MLERRAWAELGGGDSGWLKAKHHFAFAGHGNPKHTALGNLIVWNDDEIAPGKRFSLHEHENVEIVTYVRKELLVHKDNLGNVSRIEAGHVQIISAGAGVRHSETNPGPAPLRLFQIWIRPRQIGGNPRWETKAFLTNRQVGSLIPVASGFADSNGALAIRADARVFGATLNNGDVIERKVDKRCQAYLTLAAGSITVNDRDLDAGDGAAISDERGIRIAARSQADFVLVETV